MKKELRKGVLIGSIIFILLFATTMYFVSMRSTISSNVVLSVEDVTFTENTIKIENFNFDPTVIRIKKGTTIEWVNLDSIKHTVTTNDLMLNSPLLSQGERYSYTFNVEGEYNYYCVPHPYMSGRIIVK